MELEPKQVICKCGHTFTAQRKKSWCEKCCRPVFYHAKDQKLHNINNVYLLTIMAGTLAFVTYLFIEVIAAPLLSLK